MNRKKMKGLHLASMAAVAFALLVSMACASTQSTSTKIDDIALVAKIKTKLAADPDINPFRINVDSEEGVVRLSGAVEKSTSREEAVRLARDTVGVKDVINDLKIGTETLGQQIDDAALASRVKARFAADPEVRARSIEVDAEDGVIVLTGRVATREQKDEAEALAWATKGVWRVRNLLKVGPEDR